MKTVLLILFSMCVGIMAGYKGAQMTFNNMPREIVDKDIKSELETLRKRFDEFDVLLNSRSVMISKNHLTNKESDLNNSKGENSYINIGSAQYLDQKSSTQEPRSAPAWVNRPPNEAQKLAYQETIEKIRTQYLTFNDLIKITERGELTLSQHQKIMQEVAKMINQGQIDPRQFLGK